MRNKKHLFFDLDHTLWDFERNAEECIKDIFEEFKGIIPSELKFNHFFNEFSVINKNLWFLLDTRQISHEELRNTRFEKVFTHCGYTISKPHSIQMNEVFLELLPFKSHLIQNAKMVLEQLHPKFSLHIISNGYQIIQVQKMKSGEILPYFDQIVTNDTANARKPEKEIFDFALFHAKAHAQESLMIGDSLEADIKGGKNAGWDTIHFDESATTKNQEKIGNLLELLEILL
jgi:putative hydrolase of the HAD superfamily